MTSLSGIPSDEAQAILATDNGGISRVFVSLATRHPSGKDAAYLAWHTLDHRPEQYRLPELRASLRIVSTSACRAARAVSSPPFDSVDHVMTYFFANDAGLSGFGTLSAALREAGRAPFVLHPVERGVYHIAEAKAASHIKSGADVLPWWPAKGVYLIVEDGPAPIDGLIDVPGVGGVWSLSEAADLIGTEVVPSASGQHITYCFLEGDAVAAAEAIRPVLEERWRESGVTPLLAAPFYTIVPHEWDHHLP